MTTRTPYTVQTHPMPAPLTAAMSYLLKYGAHVEDSGRDADGHHLIMTKGSLRAEVTLCLDYYADGVDWADGDLTWTLTDNGRTVEAPRWSHVCRQFEARP